MDTLTMGERVALNSGGPVMTVYGLGQEAGETYYLCAWIDRDGQAQKDRFGEATIHVVPNFLAIAHTRCGQPVSIAQLEGDVAYYVYCEHCRDLVEDGELSPAPDETKVRIRVDGERVRPVYCPTGHDL